MSDLSDEELRHTAWVANSPTIANRAAMELLHRRLEREKMRDWRHTSEALDDIPLKPNLNKLGLQRGPQPDPYGYAAKRPDLTLWGRFKAWWVRGTWHSGPG